MKFLRNHLAYVIIIASSLWAFFVDAAQLPIASTTDTVAVKLHHWEYTDPFFDRIASAGFKIVQTDLEWSEVETMPGSYNFSGTQYLHNFDVLVRRCTERGMRVEFSLFRQNPIYSTDVNSPVWRQHYADYAVAAVNHFNTLDGGAYAGNVMYQIWQEPDGEGYWPSTPYDPENESVSEWRRRWADEYMDLVELTVPQMRAADANCTIFAPELATANRGWSQVDSYLDQCLVRGLATASNSYHVDAITFHPYRDAYTERDIPETVVPDYAYIRDMVDDYNPAMPLGCTEWGYSSSTDPSEGFLAGSLQLQADYAVRQHLVNISQGLTFSGWFKWNDASNHYGIVENDDYTAKPAYYAVQEMTSSLRGTTFSQRLASSSQDWLLEFVWPNSDEKTLVAWTTGDPHQTYRQSWGGWIDLAGTPIYLNPVPTPEPNTITLSSMGLISIFTYFWRKWRQKCLL